MTSPTYRTVELKNTNVNDVQEALNTLHDEGYEFVQGWSMCSSSSLRKTLTTLVFKQFGQSVAERPYLSDATQQRLRDRELMLDGLDAPDEAVPVVDPLLAGLQR